MKVSGGKVKGFIMVVMEGNRSQLFDIDIDFTRAFYAVSRLVTRDLQFLLSHQRQASNFDMTLCSREHQRLFKVSTYVLKLATL